jgi:hypothetical protein
MTGSMVPGGLKILNYIDLVLKYYSETNKY